MDLQIRPNAHSTSRADDHGRQKTILIVDDIPEVRRTYAYMFGQAGWRTLVAEDGTKCLEALATTVVDALLLDIFMPNMDGIEVLLQARANIPNLAIVSVSGGAGAWKGALQAPLKLGADMALSKTDSIKTLIHAVEACVAKRARPEESSRHTAVALAESH